MRKDFKINVDYGDISDSYFWDEFCSKYGINYYCMNEGLVNRDDTIAILLSDALAWNIIQESDLE